MKLKNTLTSLGKVTLLSLTLLLSSISLQAQTFVEKHGRLQVQGNRIIDKNNEEVSLAGNSLFWSIAGDISDFYNTETIEHIATDWNSSVVRAAMGVQETWDAGRGYIDDPEYQKTKIRTVINAAIEQGIYVIIDWHSHEAELYTEEAASFFKEMAQLYGDTPNVIYEIYNEPIEQSWPTIKQYAETVIEAIRSEDPDNLIVVGTRFYSQEVDVASENPIVDTNIAYTLHFYAGTHGQNLRNRALTALNNGVALFVTEWGAVEASGDGAIAFEETQRWMNFLNDHNISHASWSLSDKPSNTDPSILEGSAQVALNGGVTALQNDQLSQYGFYVKDLIQNWANFESTIPEIVSTTIIDFDDNTTTLNPFNGLTVDIITNPELSGSNETVSNVGAITNSAVTNFEGFGTTALSPINFEANSSKTLIVDVYSTTAVNVDLQVKAINTLGATMISPRGASKTTAHNGTGWETLTFDFSSGAIKSFDGFEDDGQPFTPEGVFNQIVMLIDSGAPAPNGAATYFIDNFKLIIEDDTTPNQAPTVSISGIENGQTFTQGDTINITADASDADGQVTKVEFFNGSELLGEDTEAPFIFEITNATAGDYLLTAVATDNQLASQTSNTISITVITETVVIIDFDDNTTTLNPFNGLIVDIVTNPDLSGSNDVISNVASITNSGVSNFEGFATATLNPIDFETNSTKTITVDVYATTAVNVDLQVKTANTLGATIMSPRGAAKSVAHNGTGWETLTFDYNSGAIKSFDGFEDDGQGFVPEGTFNQIVVLIDPGAPAPNGAGTYFIDNFELIVENDITPNQAPTVRIPNISNGRIFNEGDIITIIANAEDADGTISLVEFFNGSEKLGEDTEAPFVFEIPTAAIGNYEFSAKATDNDQATETSSSVSVTVNPFTPPASQGLTFVEKHGRLQVQGNRIVDKNNEEVSLAGNSLFWSIAGDTSDFYNAEAIEHIATEWNSAIVRAAMGVQEDDSFDNNRGFIEDPEYQKEKIRRVIDAAIEQGIYVIIDWHSHDAELYTEEAVGFFKEMAQIYGDTPNVIYEIYNEPIEQSWPTIKAYAETVIEAIRSEDPDNLIIVGTRFFSQEVDVASEDPIIDNNVAYTLHFYAGTHGQSLRNRALTALNNGVALFVTEWGAVEASGDGAISYEETLRWMNFLKENNISHASWSLSDKPSNTNPSVIEGSAKIILNGGVAALQNDGLSEYGYFVKDIIQNWTGFKSTNDSEEGLRTIIDFDNNTTDLNPFNGLQVDIITNPELSGSNTTASNVGLILNSGINNFEGFATGIIAPVDFGPNSTKTILVDVFATTPVNVDLQVKAVNEFGMVIPTPRGASKTVGHSGTGWEELEFDFNEFANKSFDGFPDDGEPNFIPEGLFTQLAMLIDAGAPSPNGAGTYYIDNFRLKLPVNTPNLAPEVSISGPENGQTFSEGENIIITAIANDPDGEVTKVEFFNGTEKIGEAIETPFTIELNEAIAGNYNLTAVATDNEGASKTSDIIEIIVIENVCDFGTPMENPLPETERASFSRVHIIGNEGPDISNFRRFRIRWLPRFNRLFLFALNTNDGKPEFYVDLIPKITHNLNSPNPDITISNSGLEGWDGAYWVANDGENFVLVSKDRGFTIYFNNDDAPDCGNQPIQSSLKTSNFEAISVYPNPAHNFVNVLNYSLESDSFSIIDIHGKIIVTTTINSYNSKVNITNLPKGIYFIRKNNSQDPEQVIFFKE